MKVYTRTGDKGETSLFTGERVRKDHPLLEVLGKIDECNCDIGCALSILPQNECKALAEQLYQIQNALFDLGAAVATPVSTATERKLALTRFDGAATTQLELWIDEMDETLTPLHTFILPGGHPASSHLQVARVACRASERAAQAIPRDEIAETIFIYLNRLSDYLFTAARFVNHQTGTPEILWQHNKGG